MECDIRLRAFRSYPFYEQRIHFPIVCLSGSNGAGKTNLLEAFSLLSPGRGLRSATFSHLQNDKSPNDPWHINLLFKTPTGPLKIETGCQEKKRTIWVNETPLRSHAELSQWVRVIWLTPSMDRLFIEGMTGRRRFLDRFVFTLDASYASCILRYEKALRERLALLTESSAPNPSWCRSLEVIMAKEAYSILCKRQKALERVHLFFPEHFRPQLLLSGAIEDCFSLHNGSEEAFCDSVLSTWATARRSDSQRSSTTFGVHRTTFEVIHPQGQEAALCSTGEQKILLISLVFALAHCVRSDSPDAFVLLLLDEIAAHLSPDVRQDVYGRIESGLTHSTLAHGVIMTGTHRGLFDAFNSVSSHIEIKRL